MSLIALRRFSQAYFFMLFFWFCSVMRLGESWNQLRGWPVNWLMNLDPLNGLATLLSTRTLYGGLWWGAVTLIATLVVGRFFCGWICPFGALHHFVGYLALYGKKKKEKIKANRPRSARNIKYLVLIFFLTGAVDLFPVHLSAEITPYVAAGWLLAAGAGIVWSLMRTSSSLSLWAVMPFAAVFLVGFRILIPGSGFLQTGLLDPMALFHRSIHVVVIPLAQRLGGGWGAFPVSFPVAAGIGSVFLALVLANLWIPRFFCRFICPTGALLGLASRFSLFSMGKQREKCSDCKMCDASCQGASNPSGRILSSECLLCMNCHTICPDKAMGFSPSIPAPGRILGPDLSRRSFFSAFMAGLFVPSFFKLGKSFGSRLSPEAVRPPGALDEKRFLARCVKCGQCMRICPTNVIRPALMEAGIEGIWTPVLDFSSGSSGCQINCVACGHLCPTAAIRPLTLEERMGIGEFKEAGPIRMGTAFVDRNRCLPWAMDRPCIVCQENCPMSPKAIFTRTDFSPVRGADALFISHVEVQTITLSGIAPMEPGRYATGDFHLFFSNGKKRARILENGADTVVLGPGPLPKPKEAAQIRIRLQKPYVDVEKCVGCGICQHECPLLHKKAIYVTAENESRDPDASILL